MLDRLLVAAFTCFYSELKRRLKAEQKAKEKAEKQQAAAAAAPTSSKPAKVNDDEIDSLVRN